MSNLFLRGVAAIAVSLFTLTSSGAASAHDEIHIGDYDLHLGWQHEPTYVGELNAVQLIVDGPDGAPVTDLTPTDVSVSISFGDQTSDPFPLMPSYDPDEGLGTPGELLAPVLPTTPGDYTFHVTGAIHGQTVDETVTSGEMTFDSVQGSSAIQFPMALPTMAELVTRIERLEARIDALSPAASPLTAP